jgi:hypothetical protein
MVDASICAGLTAPLAELCIAYLDTGLKPVRSTLLCSCPLQLLTRVIFGVHVRTAIAPCRSGLYLVAGCLQRGTRCPFPLWGDVHPASGWWAFISMRAMVSAVLFSRECWIATCSHFGGLNVAARRRNSPSDDKAGEVAARAVLPHLEARFAEATAATLGALERGAATLRSACSAGRPGELPLGRARLGALRVRVARPDLPVYTFHHWSAMRDD